MAGTPVVSWPDEGREASRSRTRSEASQPSYRPFSPMRNMVTSLFGNDGSGSSRTRRSRSPPDMARGAPTTLSGAFYFDGRGPTDGVPLACNPLDKPRSEDKPRSAADTVAECRSIEEQLKDKPRSDADMVAECRSICGILKHLLESDIYRSKPTEQVDLFQQASIGITLDGIHVESCLVGSPAHASRSINEGDVITKINGTPVTAETVRAGLIGENIPGSMVCLDIKKQSGDTKQVMIQRTSTLALAEKRKMSDLITKLRQNALLAHDNATLRVLNDLEITWDSMALSEADQAAAVRQSWDKTRTQAAQHLASLRHLLDKLDVMDKTRHEHRSTYAAGQMLDKLDVSTETLTQVNRELEDEIRSSQGSKREERESEIMVLRSHCKTLEKELVACEKRREQAEVRALEETENMATLVDDLRRKLEEQLKELRADHDRFEFERDNMEKQLNDLRAELKQVEFERDSISIELKVAASNAPPANYVVDDVLECYDCKDKDAMIRSQESAINELRLQLARAESAKEGAHGQLLSSRPFGHAVRPCNGCVEKERSICEQQDAIDKLNAALVTQLNRELEDKIREHAVRPCSGCVEKERSICEQQDAIDKLNAALVKAEESSKAGAADSQGLDGAVDITIKLGMDFSSAGEEGTIKRDLFHQGLLLDIVAAAAIPPSRLSIKEFAPGSIVVSARIGPDPFGRGPSAEYIANELTKQAADSKSKLRSGKITRHIQHFVASSTISFSEMLQQTLRESQEQLKRSQEKVLELEKQRDELPMEFEALALQVDGLERKMALAVEQRFIQLNAAHVISAHVPTIARLDESKYVYENNLQTTFEHRRDKDVKRDADDEVTSKMLKESQEKMRESQEQLKKLQKKVREVEEHRDHLLMDLEALSLQVYGPEKKVALADADMLPAQQSALAARATLMHVRGGAQELDRGRNTTNAQLDEENQELHETISELRRDIDVGHDANDEYFQGMVIKLERMERERDDMKTARDRLQGEISMHIAATLTYEARIADLEDQVEGAKSGHDELSAKMRAAALLTDELRREMAVAQREVEEAKLDKAKLDEAKLAFEQDREALRAEREMIQSTMELAEQRFVASLELAEQRFVAEKQAIERAHADQRDLWQIELSKEKYLFDKEVKSIQAYHDRDKALFQARMEKEGLSLQIELGELRAELSTALEDAESKLAAAFKMQRDEKDKMELQISSFLQDIESARAEALAQSLSARVLVDEKAELALDVSRLDVKLFASKQEIEDLREKLELASVNQSLLQKERDSLINERQRKIKLTEKEHTTELLNLQRICNDLMLEKAEQNKQISMLNNQIDRKNQQLLQDAPPGALRSARRSSLPGAQDEMEITKLRSQAADLASENEAMAKELLSMKGKILQLVKERDEARQIAESLHAKFSDLLANHNMIMPSGHEPTDNMNREVSPPLSGASCGDSIFSQGSHSSRTANGRPVSRPYKLQRPKVLPGDDGDYSSDSSTSFLVCSDP